MSFNLYFMHQLLGVNYLVLFPHSHLFVNLADAPGVLQFLLSFAQESGTLPPPSEDLLDMVGSGMPVKDCLLSVLALDAVDDFSSFWQLKGDNGAAASVLFCWFFLSEPLISFPIVRSDLRI